MATKHHILAEKSSGYIINLITKDMINIQQAIITLVALFTPIEILAVSCLLWKLVGWQTIGGVVLSFVLIACQVALGKISKILEGKVTKLNDRRMRLIYDVVSGIRLLKMNAWEWCFRDLVSGVRRYVVSLNCFTSVVSCSLSYQDVSNL